MAFENNRSGGYGQNRPAGNFGGNDRRPKEPELTLRSEQIKAIKFGEAIPTTLYSDIPEGLARDIGEYAKQWDRNKGTQLRRFYDEVVMLQNKVGTDKDKFAAQAPYIQMIKAKIAYALGRKKVDPNFEQLLRHVIDEVKDPASFAQAKLFMEAFMAFYKVHGPKD